MDFYGISETRLRELAQADREGRCVVLDVKIGQEVWILDAGDYGDDDEAYPLELNIGSITLSDKHEIYYFIESPLGMNVDPFSHKDIGKTVFLTRAEAEAALRREQDGNNKLSLADDLLYPSVTSSVDMSGKDELRRIHKELERIADELKRRERE